MNKNATARNGVFKLLHILLLTTILLGFGKTSLAHKVEKYTVSCFLQGETVTINTTLSSIGYNSYMHWQCRVSPGGAWAYLANGNNTINGRTFYITGASQPTYIEDSTENLVIANVGSPAYTTQLDNVEFRLLMTDFGLDPETNPGIPIYGAEEYGDRYAKYIRIRARPAGENCYSACTNNMLVINPAQVPPPLADYFGGFEVPGGSAGNFSTPGTNGVTAKAATDITQWTTGTLGTNPKYRIVNNPDSMNNSFSAFAPHSGMNMMVVNANNSCSNRVWYRTITVANTAQFYQGSMIFRAWFSKISGTTADPAVMLEIKGGTAVTSSTASYVSLGSSTQTITGTPGTWVQMVLVVNIPVNSYKKLEVSIKTPNGCTSAAYVAIDDLCLIEPVSGLLPIVMTPLKASYANGISHLYWSSLQEQNSSYFEVQRSNDGVNFTYLSKVTAKGSSDVEVNYHFDDIKADAGVNYYRLKLVDRDGRYQYSNIATVNVNIKGTTITGVYPSPFTNKVNIAVASKITGRAVISLFDNSGKLLATQQSILNKGINNLVLDNLDKLAKGFYIMKIQVGDVVTVKKLIK